MQDNRSPGKVQGLLEFTKWFQAHGWLILGSRHAFIASQLGLLMHQLDTKKYWTTTLVTHVTPCDYDIDK